MTLVNPDADRRIRAIEVPAWVWWQRSNPIFQRYECGCVYVELREGPCPECGGAS